MNQRKGTGRTHPPDLDGADRRSFVIWWVAAFLLMLAATPLWGKPVPLLQPPDNSLLSRGQAWNPPLSYIGGLPEWAAVPYWLYAAVASLLLAIAAAESARSLHPVVAGLFLVGMCNVNNPTPLFAALAILLAVKVRKHWTKISTEQHDRIRGSTHAFALAVLAVVAAAAMTLEFGIVVFLLTTVVLRETLAASHRSQRLLPRFMMVSGWISLLLIPAFLASGYGAAALRPLSAMWLRPPKDLLPSLVPVWQSSDFGLAHICVLVLIAERWRVHLRDPRPSLYNLELAVLSAIAVASTRYFWIAAFAIALTEDPGTRPRTSSRFARFTPHACVALGCIFLVAQLVIHGGTILRSDSLARSIDPLEWGVQGPLMLTELEQSSHWQLEPTQQALPLVISNRWDVHGSFYPEYDAICNDWKNWRREAYVRADGSWGGFGRWFDAWKPALVAIDSSDLDALRLVSLDSHWKLMGMDAERAFFAHSGNPYAVAQQRQARQLLSVLDVPRPSAHTDFERAIRLGSDADARRLSLMLTALRFPFAALRILPDDNRRPTELARIWAWLELAHRTQRYTGQRSLLNQSRAMIRWNAMQDGGRVSSELQQRLRDARDALAEPESSPPSASATKERNQEFQVRAALLAGDAVEAKQLAEKLEVPAARRLYQIIADSAWQSNRETRDDLRETARTRGMRPELRNECLYYAGILAIESGDFLLAQDSFRSMDGGSSFTQMASLYLQQLQP